jgi:hypothetical protein
MAHGTLHDTGILANQNITKYQAMQALIVNGSLLESRWRSNLGVDAARDVASAAEANPGWTGYSWGPPDISHNPLNNDVGDQLNGPQGSERWTFQPADVVAGKPEQYGPASFARLDDSSNPGQTNGSTYSSLLTSLAYMVATEGGSNKVLNWDTTAKSPGARMKETFTSGDQTPSLNNKIAIPAGRIGAGRPVASGGTTKGYQFDHPYDFDTAQEVREASDTGQAKTGLRNIKDMVTG